MTFNTGAALLDAVVLSVVAQEGPSGTYGYRITQDVRLVMDISESTLYPVLRRLQKDGSLDTHDKQFDGRNRRYYTITSNGMIQLDQYRREWSEYKKKVEQVLFGGKMQ